MANIACQKLTIMIIQVRNTEGSPNSEIRQTLSKHRANQLAEEGSKCSMPAFQDFLFRPGSKIASISLSIGLSKCT
jgi:hypothetical protein